MDAYIDGGLVGGECASLTVAAAEHSLLPFAQAVALSFSPVIIPRRGLGHTAAMGH